MLLKHHLAFHSQSNLFSLVGKNTIDKDEYPLEGSLMSVSILLSASKVHSLTRVAKVSAEYSFSDPAAESPVFEVNEFTVLADDMERMKRGSWALFSCTRCADPARTGSGARHLPMNNGEDDLYAPAAHGSGSPQA